MASATEYLAAPGCTAQAQRLKESQWGGRVCCLIPLHEPPPFHPPSHQLPDTAQSGTRGPSFLCSIKPIQLLLVHPCALAVYLFSKCVLNTCSVPVTSVFSPLAVNIREQAIGLTQARHQGPPD